MAIDLFKQAWHPVPDKPDTWCQCTDGWHGPQDVAFWGAATLLNAYAKELTEARDELQCIDRGNCGCVSVDRKWTSQ